MKRRNRKDRRRREKMRLNIMKLLMKNRLITKEMREMILKNMLLNNNLINRNKWENINNNMNELRNMKDNNWQLNMYNYNKNNERWLIINDTLVEKLLRKIMNMRMNKVLISKVQFNHSINKVYIKYYYYNIDNNNNMYSNMMLRLINNMNRLSNILSYYYDKEVIIEPIKVTYVYMNSNIMSDYIKLLMNNNMDLNNQLVTFNNKSNIDQLMREYLSMINNMLPINNNNNFINLVMNRKDRELSDNGEDMLELMRYKYLMGWSIRLKGKLNKLNARSVKLNIINGTFKNNDNKYYKYNNLPNNHYVANTFNVNKDGKYNIKVKLNYI